LAAVAEGELGDDQRGLMEARIGEGRKQRERCKDGEELFHGRDPEVEALEFEMLRLRCSDARMVNFFGGGSGKTKGADFASPRLRSIAACRMGRRD